MEQRHEKKTETYIMKENEKVRQNNCNEREE